MKGRTAKSKQGKQSKQKSSRFSFATDIYNELRRVIWPTRQEAIRLSILVLVACIVMGIILGGVDYGFTGLVNELLLGGR